MINEPTTRIASLLEDNDRLEQVLLDIDPDSPLYWKFTEQISRNCDTLDRLRTERNYR